MKKSQSFLMLQSFLHGLQVINVAVAGSSKVPVWIAVGIAATCAGIGFYVQQVGNQLDPKDQEQAKAAGAA